MKNRIQILAEQNFYWGSWEGDGVFTGQVDLEKFAELIVQECMDQVKQTKNNSFVSLDDAKRMSHFVDVTKKKIREHFGVEE